MKIPLTQGKFTPVGWKEYKYLIQWKWYYAKDRKGGYAVRSDYTSGKCKTIRMHRVILERMGHINFEEGDHINGDKLDNRRSNLRPATYSQSQHNQGGRKNSTSKYKGVSWYKRAKKWQAQIGVDRKTIYLGFFNDEKEAALAHNKAAIKYHGEFAKLNRV